MKERNQDLVKKTLKPYREAIDLIDDQILELLGQRFSIVRTVAGIKIKHGIPAFLGDRVSEVRNRNVERARKYGITKEFLTALYTLLIYESCATEDLLKFAHMNKAKKPASKASARKPKKTAR